MKSREQLLTTPPLLEKEVQLRFNVIDGVEPQGWDIGNLGCQKMTQIGPTIGFSHIVLMGLDF